METDRTSLLRPRAALLGDEDRALVGPPVQALLLRCVCVCVDMYICIYALCIIHNNAHNTSAITICIYSIRCSSRWGGRLPRPPRFAATTLDVCFYFVCDRGKRRSAKRYNVGCNFVPCKPTISEPSTPTKAQMASLYNWNINYIILDAPVS